jgi:hypothetical protein
MHRPSRSRYRTEARSRGARVITLRARDGHSARTRPQSSRADAENGNRVGRNPGRSGGALRGRRPRPHPARSSRPSPTNSVGEGTGRKSLNSSAAVALQRCSLRSAGDARAHACMPDSSGFRRGGAGSFRRAPKACVQPASAGFCCSSGGLQPPGWSGMRHLQPKPVQVGEDGFSAVRRSSASPGSPRETRRSTARGNAR